jgi:hypothetical protein
MPRQVSFTKKVIGSLSFEPDSDRIVVPVTISDDNGDYAQSVTLFLYRSLPAAYVNDPKSMPKGHRLMPAGMKQAVDALLNITDRVTDTLVDPTAPDLLKKATDDHLAQLKREQAAAEKAAKAEADKATKKSTGSRKADDKDEGDNA